MNLDRERAPVYPFTGTKPELRKIFSTKGAYFFVSVHDGVKWWNKKSFRKLSLELSKFLEQMCSFDIICSRNHKIYVSRISTLNESCRVTVHSHDAEADVNFIQFFPKAKRHLVLYSEIITLLLFAFIKIFIYIFIYNE